MGELFYIRTLSLGTVVERRWAMNEIEQWWNTTVRMKWKDLEKSQS